MIGPGLLGGSVLKAVAERIPSCERRIWARRSEALADPTLDSLVSVGSTDVTEVVSGVELVILAVPIQHMRSIVDQFPQLGPGTVVTDVGSTKVSVVAELTDAVAELGGEFIGSHPMAGSEKSGMAYASAGLLEGAAVVLTPRSESAAEAPAVSRLAQFWESLGGVTHLMSAVEHDHAVASISHLPHLLASALARHCLSGDGLDRARLAGGGFRDTTRVAAGEPEMWTEISLANQAALKAQLDGLIDELSSWRESLDSLDKEALRRLFSEAKKLRDQVV